MSSFARCVINNSPREEILYESFLFGTFACLGRNKTQEVPQATARRDWPQISSRIEDSSFQMFYSQFYSYSRLAVALSFL